MSEEVSREILEPLLRSSALFIEDGPGCWQIPSRLPSLTSFLPDTTFAVVDIETTGGRPPQHRITEIAAVKVRAGEIGEEFHSLVSPMREIPWNVVRLTGITDEMVAQQPGVRDVLPAFLDFVDGCVFVGHGATFDHLFIHYFAREVLEREFDPAVLCTFKLAQRLLPSLGRYNLGELSTFLGIGEDDRHRALGDARVTAEVLLRFLMMLQVSGLQGIEKVFSFQEPPPPEEEPALVEGILLTPADIGALPSCRGVFRLLDAAGETVYATKAGDIQRAVKEIFYPKNKSAARFAEKLRAVHRVEALPSESELGMSIEAVRSMRDSRIRNGHPLGGTQNFLKIEVVRKYPRVMAAGRFLPDGSAYYGPFRKQAQLRDLLEVILRLFPLRLAPERGEEAKKEEKDKRPLPDVSPKLYGRMVEALQDFLEGRLRRRGEQEL
ncbi:MAG: exonuclease domain-containing protein, partial [bacterium]|nr:exonuclease domain-containing protein [bacterium]